MIACACVSVAGCRQLLGLDEGAVIDASSGSADTTPVDEALPDGVNGHDEDGDLIPDSSDNCPSIANTNQLIEDGVGLVCDPRPNVAGDRIALFLPFFPAGMPPEVELSGVAFNDDEAVLDDHEMRLANDARPIRIAANIVVTESGQNEQIEVSVGGRVCRIEECGSGMCVRASDGLTSTSQAFTAMIPYTAMFVLTQNASELRCTLELQPPVSAAITENGSVENRVRVRALRTTITVKSLTLYDTTP